MSQAQWKKPVLLERFGVPGLVVVANVEDAARLILQIPAERRGPAQIEALRTIRDVLMQRASSCLARANFIGAALEAGYYVMPETFFDLAVTPSEQQISLEAISGEHNRSAAGWPNLRKRLTIILSHRARKLPSACVNVRASLSHLLSRVRMPPRAVTKPVRVWI